MKEAEPWSGSLLWFGKPQGADEAAEGTEGQLQPEKRQGHPELSSVCTVPPVGDGPVYSAWAKVILLWC